MTLYRENPPCKHGYSHSHRYFSTGPSCPGGSREEVTIDYEAAAAARYDAYVESLVDYKPIPSFDPWSWEDLPPIPKAKFRQDAIVTINAALSVTVERPSWMKANTERESA